MKVEQLGYLIFDITPDKFAAMRSVFADVIGADVSDKDDGSVVVRLDGRAHRIILRPRDQYQVAAIGWEVADQAALDALVARLMEQGLSVETADQAALDARQAQALVRFVDANGFNTELFVDRPFDLDPALSERFICGKRDSGNFGMGHIVLSAKDRFATRDFYRDTLGFGLSDQISWGEADLYFLHCNKRHHSVAIAGEIFGMKAGDIDHFMIETTEKARVDEAYVRLQELGFAVSQTLGEHSNDGVYSFYMLAPSGFRVEFGYGGSTIEDSENWEAGFYDSPSTWGHELQMPPA